MAAAPPTGVDMRRSALLSGMLTGFLGASLAVADSAVVIVQGLGGNETYRAAFNEQVGAIADAVRTLSPLPELRVFSEDESSREAVLEHLAALAGRLSDDDQLYLYLIGHGSYDDEEYKFNIPGPDLTGTDIREALDRIPSRYQVVVNTSSASGAAAETWQADDRVVIAATRSGSERHATRFGEHFVAALDDPSADVDKNRIVSAQEAFNFADRRVADYFESNGILPTEHARLDGELANRFTLARLGESRPVPGDSRMDELIEARDTVAARLESLRLSRSELTPDEYQSELLNAMLELAEAEEAIEQREAELADEANR